MPKRLWLYDEGTAPALHCDEVALYLAETVPGCASACRGGFVSHWLAGSGETVESLAATMAALKIRDFSSPLSDAEPLPGEIAYERRRLENRNRGSFGVAYDGFRFQALLAELLGPREPDALHIAFTNRLLATWEPGDLRYHLRTIVCGAPCAISTSGLVEAPAKPREFYAARQALGSLAAGPAYEALKQQFEGRFLDHDDARLTEVAKGYVLQAAAYHLTGEPFCDNPRCRLHNAHWQEEMLAAQLGGEVCERHRRMFQERG